MKKTILISLLSFALLIIYSCGGGHTQAGNTSGTEDQEKRKTEIRRTTRTGVKESLLK